MEPPKLPDNVLPVPLRKDGVHSGPQLLPQAPATPVMTALSQATSLKDLAKELVFYTHGLLFTRGGWQRDPIEDYIAESNGACQPMFIKLPSPVFKWYDYPGGSVAGQPANAVDWNSTICAVSRDRWPSLYRYLCLTEGVNFQSKIAIRLIAQKIPIVDVLALARLSSLPEKAPTVDCFCFALLTNKKTVYFAPELRKEPWEPVPVMQRNPDSRFQKHAAAVLSSLSG